MTPPPDHASRPKGRRRVLFVQATEAAAYPPVINASLLMAEAGWQVDILSAPIQGNSLAFPAHPRITLHATPVRPSHVLGARTYAGYVAAAAALALRRRPDVVYASDPMGAAPGLAAAFLAAAKLVYHEHDSPQPNGLKPSIARARRLAGQRAKIVVFPNEGRARGAARELGYHPDRLRIVWNLPRLAELPVLAGPGDGPLVAYYHGSISPDRLPLAVVEALTPFAGRVRLRLAGYEAAGAAGYIAALLERGAEGSVEYRGQISREHLLQEAARADIGLALLPTASQDVNTTQMIGASNKAFDYMAAGLAMLVSDLPDWQGAFVEPGYALACRPTDPAAIAAAVGWLYDHPAERRAMGVRNRAKIEAEWNYDAAFRPVLEALSDD